MPVEGLLSAALVCVLCWTGDGVLALLAPLGAAPMVETWTVAEGLLGRKACWGGGGGGDELLVGPATGRVGVTFEPEVEAGELGL